jgi:hypothetical protein
MTKTQIILTILTTIALFTKGSHLIRAIRKNVKEQVKVELLFFSLILILGVFLIAFFNK